MKKVILTGNYIQYKYIALRLGEKTNYADSDYQLQGLSPQDYVIITTGTFWRDRVNDDFIRAFDAFRARGGKVIDITIEEIINESRTNHQDR